MGICLAGSVQAGGYRVATQGQKALGMGHTGVAMTDSAESIFFNPSAITKLKADSEIVGGISLLKASTQYVNEETLADVETEDKRAKDAETFLVNPFNLFPEIICIDFFSDISAVLRVDTFKANKKADTVTFFEFLQNDISQNR